MLVIQHVILHTMESDEPIRANCWFGMENCTRNILGVRYANPERRRPAYPGFIDAAKSAGLTIGWETLRRGRVRILRNFTEVHWKYAPRCA